MKYKVLGVKKVKGTNKKTQVPYSGVELHVVYKDPEVWGSAVCPVFVNDNLGLPDVPNINPNDYVNIEYNNRGFVCLVEKLPTEEKK